MDITEQAYHLYLVIYGGNSLMKKIEEGVFPVEEECEKVVMEVESNFLQLQRDLHQNPNRYMILNHCTGLYLGNEDISIVKKKFASAIIITKADPCAIYINFEKQSQFVYKYLVSQWLRLNKLV